MVVSRDEALTLFEENKFKASSGLLGPKPSADQLLLLQLAWAAYPWLLWLCSCPRCLAAGATKNP